MFKEIRNGVGRILNFAMPDFKETFHRQIRKLFVCWNKYHVSFVILCKAVNKTDFIGLLLIVKRDIMYEHDYLSINIKIAIT